MTKQVQWVEEFCEKEEYSLVEICAAIVKNSIGDEEKMEIKEERSRDNNNNGRNNRRKNRSAADMTRLFLNVGRKQKVQAKDILGSIAGETGVKGSHIGNIDVYDKYTFVDVDKDMAKTIITKMKNRKIKGNKLNIERANRKSK